MLIVHAGNRIDAPDRVTPRFPEAHAASIRSRLEILLKVLAPDRVVTAAAAGADILVLEAAERLGVPTTVVLPLPREEFRRRSVADQGGTWPRRFDAALEAADEVVEHDLSGEDEWYLLGNEVILDTAAARTDETPLVVAVRAGSGSATDDLVDRARSRGSEVIDLDPSVDPSSRSMVDVGHPMPPELVAALIDRDLGWRFLAGAGPDAVLPEAVRERAQQLRVVVEG